MVDKVPAPLVEDIIVAIEIDQTDGATADSISDSIQLGGRVPTMIYMPVAWTAAGITFNVSFDGATFVSLDASDATEVLLVVEADRGINIDSAAFRGAKYLKIRSGTLATPVDQTTARTLQVAFGNPRGIG